MRRWRYILTVSALVVLHGCGEASTPEPVPVEAPEVVVAPLPEPEPIPESVAHGTAYVTSESLTFRSGGKLWHAPVGSSVAGPGFADLILDLHADLKRSRLECEVLAQQLVNLQREYKKRAAAPDTTEPEL